MRINPFSYGVLVLGVFTDLIMGAQQFGVWSTSGKVNAAGQTIQPSSADVNAIEGWMML